MVVPIYLWTEKDRRLTSEADASGCLVPVYKLDLQQIEEPHTDSQQH